MTISASDPKLSPSLDEFDMLVMTDPSSNLVPCVALVHPSASDGASELAGLTVIPGKTSQVTGKRGLPMLDVPGIGRMPVLGVYNVGAAGAPVKAGAKFQSTVQTGTGASQNVAHGLGVAPSMVLLSIYDTNGVALPHAMAEGAHDATNVKATVTSGVKFKVIAFV